MRKPYYRKSHRCWYVTTPKTRREVRLDPDEAKAYELWRRLLDASAPLTSSVPLRRLAEHFLDQTYEVSRAFDERARLIAAFVNFVGSKQAIVRGTTREYEPDPTVQQFQICWDRYDPGAASAIHRHFDIINSSAA